MFFDCTVHWRICSNHDWKPQQEERTGILAQNVITVQIGYLKSKNNIEICIKANILHSARCLKHTEPVQNVVALVYCLVICLNYKKKGSLFIWVIFMITIPLYIAHWRVFNERNGFQDFRNWKVIQQRSVEQVCFMFGSDK